MVDYDSMCPRYAVDGDGAEDLKTVAGDCNENAVEIVGCSFGVDAAGDESATRPDGSKLQLRYPR